MFNIFKRAKKSIKNRANMDKYTVTVGEVYLDKRVNHKIRVVGVNKKTIYTTMVHVDEYPTEDGKIPVVEYTPEIFFRECEKVA